MTAELETLSDYGVSVVARKPSTVRQLVKVLDDLRRDRGMTLYEVAKRSGLDLNTVTRFFSGYARLGKKAASDPDRPGRVRLDSALVIAHALGCDFKIVACENPGRPV